MYEVSLNNIESRYANIIFYLKNGYAPCKFELKKAIGASTLPWLACMSIAAYYFSETNVYKMKGLEKFGVARDGALTITCLIRLNASYSTWPHLKSEFFLIIAYNGDTILEKSGTNVLKKLIWPRKDCIAFLLCGKDISEISLILSGSIWILDLDTVNPRSFPSLNAKKDFFGLSQIPYLWQRWKICFKSLWWLLHFLEYIVMSSK